jgi:hypothetical protein
VFCGTMHGFIIEIAAPESIRNFFLSLLII